MEATLVAQLTAALAEKARLWRENDILTRRLEGLQVGTGVAVHSRVAKWRSYSVTAVSFPDLHQRQKRSRGGLRAQSRTSGEVGHCHQVQVGACARYW